MKRQFFVVLLLMSMFSAIFAVSETKDLKAVYNNIKVFIDGKYVTHKDSQGKVIEPFIVNGVTYIPVGVLPEITGKNVSWDAKTQSVCIGTEPSGLKVKTWLTDMVPTVSKRGYDNDYLSHGGFNYTDLLLTSNIPDDNYGNSYYRGGLINKSDYSLTWFQYPLETKYTKLSGKFILPNSEKNTNSYHRLTVYSLFNNNRTVLYKSPKITSGSRSVDVLVDVTGVVDLIIELSTVDVNDKLYYHSQCAFVEAGFE